MLTNVLLVQSSKVSFANPHHPFYFWFICLSTKIDLLGTPGSTPESICLNKCLTWDFSQESFHQNITWDFSVESLLGGNPYQVV